MLAQAKLPAPADMKTALTYLDIGIKLEMVLYDLQAALYWGSLAELSSFLFTFLLFCSNASQMAGFWLFIFHAARGGLGLFILKKLPASHNVIAGIKVSSTSQKVSFGGLEKHVVKTGSEAFDKFSTDIGKLFLLIYTALTLLCFIVDLIMFFVYVGSFTADATAFPNTCLLLMSSVFICCDLYYLVSVFSSAFQFPATLRKHVLLSQLGYFKNVTLTLNALCEEHGIPPIPVGVPPPAAAAKKKEDKPPVK